MPATIKLISLPPYSPELNPVEHVWEYLRENSFKNFSLHSLDEVVDILADGLSFLSQPPEIVRSMTNYDWLITLPDLLRWRRFLTGAPSRVPPPSLWPILPHSPDQVKFIIY